MPLKLFVPLLMLVVFLAIFIYKPKPSYDRIKEEYGKTIITVKVTRLPDPSSTNVVSRANILALEAFKRDFPAIFVKKYKAKYEADPEKYGDYNWDNVEIKLIAYSGIHIEGVKTDKMAIAAETAPDVFNINFRMSSSFIQNGFTVIP